MARVVHWPAMAFLSMALPCACANHGEPPGAVCGDIAYLQTGTLACSLGCNEMRPFLVGSEVAVYLTGLAEQSTYRARFLQPETIGGEARNLEKIGYDRQCAIPGCVNQPALLVQAHDPGSGHVLIETSDGRVCDDLTLEARTDEVIVLRVWKRLSENEEVLIEPDATATPTWSVEVGDQIQLGWSVLDADGVELVGHDAVTWTCTEPAVLACDFAWHAIAAVDVGTADIVAETPDAVYRYHFLVSEPSLP